MENSNNREFWQFSDQLRLHTANLANLSIGNSIWSDNRINLDSNANPPPPPAAAASDGWKMGGLGVGIGTTQKLAFGYGFNNNNHNNNNLNLNTNDIGGSGKGGSYGNNNYFNNNNYNKNYFNKAVTKPAMNTAHGINNRKNNHNNDYAGNGKKKSPNNHNSNNNNNNNNNNNGSSVDKRFKTLPPSEALPRNEAVGGYIFVCNNDTMQENLKRQLFGLPPRYRDSVRAITPGLPLFLYNYSTHQLHGIFEAASFGGTNIDPMAWEDKKSHGESRFPAQVRVLTRMICEPLEEDSFRPILHHYDGPKFRLELSVPEALALLDIFAETNA